MLMRLWRDESGAILSAELVLLMTVLVIGMVVGVKSMGSAVMSELADVGAAVGELDQSYSYSGTQLEVPGAPPVVCAWTDGSAWVDGPDPGDGPTIEVCVDVIDAEGI